MFKTKNLTPAGHFNNCKSITNHFIMQPNPGFKAVDMKYLMAGNGIEKALKTP